MKSWYVRLFVFVLFLAVCPFAFASGARESSLRVDPALQDGMAYLHWDWLLGPCIAFGEGRDRVLSPLVFEGVNTLVDEPATNKYHARLETDLMLYRIGTAGLVVSDTLCALTLYQPQVSAVFALGSVIATGFAIWSQYELVNEVNRAIRAYNDAYLSRTVGDDI